MKAGQLKIITFNRIKENIPKAMESRSYDAIVIGAGAAGLVAARYLQDYHLQTLVLDSGDRAGGRLQTDEFQGYKLDHGFQVLLTEYPMVQKYLDLEALELSYFDSGAFLFEHSKQFTVWDVKRHKSALPKMALSPVGSFMDKIRLGNLRARLIEKSNEEIFNAPELTTQQYLKELGFSDRIIERFFRPFYGGIFLEPHLETSSRMFEFTFKMFARGEAALPAKGIEAIPRQLKSQLTKTDFRFQTQVDQVNSGSVTLSSGELIEAKQIIIACEAPQLLPQLESPQSWKSTTQFYFSAPRSPMKSKLIGLQYGDDSYINNLAVLSDISPALSPRGQSLISVTLQDRPSQPEEEVFRNIRSALTPIFGSSVEEWELLRSFHVARALPQVNNVQYSVPFEQTRIKDGVYVAGDYLLNPSLNGAMLSGELAAKALVLNHVNP